MEHKSLRIVCLSDTHGSHEQVNVPEGDVLIHAGDCTMDIGRASLREFLKWFNEQPHEHKVLIAGNHDGAFEKWPTLARNMVDEMTKGVHYLEDSGCTIGPYRFWGSPYTPEFYDWHFMCKRGEDIKRHWGLIPQDTDVLITHGPPYGTLDMSNNWNNATGRKHEDYLGCEDLRDAIEKRRISLHVFGHIHGSGGKMRDRYWSDHDDSHKTICVNASIMDETYVPDHKPVVIDL